MRTKVSFDTATRRSAGMVYCSDSLKTSDMRNDLARLAELRRLMILDSSAERAYDDITRLLATSLDVPLTIVNLLDDERDWFKSCVGLEQRESPATTSFCEAFFKEADDTIVVEDMLKDPRFYAHPLVVGPPYIRFYAAARLVVNGHTVGTLCAYDIKPRQLTPEQLNQLRMLAGTAMELLKQRSPGGAA
jgi:GAF domain-containing protein